MLQRNKQRQRIRTGRQQVAFRRYVLVRFRPDDFQRPPRELYFEDDWAGDACPLDLDRDFLAWPRVLRQVLLHESRVRDRPVANANDDIPDKEAGLAAGSRRAS